ncbi:MAG: hypothetical protein HKN70_05925 [Gammaproteobacteria bacterium]|nr:hypothetical protein [Gammaproteobacteria bacterium]
MSIQKFMVGFALVVFTAGVMAEHFYSDSVEVEIVNERGRALPAFAAIERQKGITYKSYLEARPGQRYAIRLTNHSAERIGLVIAVDGRNIISGKRSKLKSKERKYVLDPFQQATYRGWRSSRNHVNEFYFTSEENSYSGAFGDYSAMGVIAVAVFRDAERSRYEEHEYDKGYQKGRPNGSSAHKNRAPAADSDGRLEKRSGEAASQPGTGYGDERYSRARQVRFREERHAAAKFLIKYEWAETLCRMGVKDCYKPRNRLWRDSYRWGNSGFAPPPPRVRYPHQRYRY